MTQAVPPKPVEEAPAAVTRETPLANIPGLAPETVETLTRRSATTLGDVLHHAQRMQGRRLRDRIWNALRTATGCLLDASDAIRASKILAPLGLAIGEADEVAPPVKKPRERKPRTKKASPDGDLFAKEDQP